MVTFTKKKLQINHLLVQQVQHSNNSKTTNQLQLQLMLQVILVIHLKEMMLALHHQQVVAAIQQNARNTSSYKLLK